MGGDEIVEYAQVSHLGMYHPRDCLLNLAYLGGFELVVESIKRDMAFNWAYTSCFGSLKVLLLLPSNCDVCIPAISLESCHMDVHKSDSELAVSEHLHSTTVNPPRRKIVAPSSVVSLIF